MGNYNKKASTLSNKPLSNSTWVSPDGMSFYIENVSDTDEDGFYLVEVIDTASKDDESSFGDELTSDEWLGMVSTFNLQLQG